MITDEAILGVIGVAISVAQCVPLLSRQTPRKGRIVAVLTLTLIVVGGGLWYRDRWQYRVLVERTKIQVLSAVTKPRTFEQLLQDLYYPSYGTLEDAVDEMIEENTLEQRRVVAVSASGDTLDVRVYTTPPVAPEKPDAKSPRS